MKIVFMGTPDFAVATLDALLKNNYTIVGVVTAPDKPAGRGQTLQQSAVKEFALKHQLKVLQPIKLKDEQFVSELKSLDADLQIVVAFRMLPEIVWNMPKHGTYNLHASLLPKYRGAAPINWAIINGENETGVTTFKLVHEIDAGNILFQEKVTISKTTNAGQLHNTLMSIGSELIIKTVNAIIKNHENNTPLNFINQKEEDVCHAPKLFKDTCKINFNDDVIKINNLIRGLSPYPAAHTTVNTLNKKLGLKIFDCETELHEADLQTKTGEIVTDNKHYIKIKCLNGYIVLKHLQIEGKKRMSCEEFLRGFKFNAGDFCD